MQHRIVGLLLSALLVVGCSNTQQEIKPTASQLAISSVQDAPFFYPKGANFAIDPKFVSSEIVSQAQEQALYQSVTLYLEQAFKARGYNFVTMEQAPDFVVKFAVALSKDLTDEMISEHFGVTPGLSNEQSLNKASVLIAVDDHKTDQRLWRGAAQGFAKEDVAPSSREQRLKSVINKVLMQFDTQG